MPNTSDKPRTFRVYFDKNVSGVAPEWETVEVAAGEDADELCGEALQCLIDNSTYSGWGPDGEYDDD